MPRDVTTVAIAALILAVLLFVAATAGEELKTVILQISRFGGYVLAVVFVFFGMKQLLTGLGLIASTDDDSELKTASGRLTTLVFGLFLLAIGLVPFLLSILR